MHRRTARGNKLGLGLTGLVLAIGGAALFAGHQGVYGSAHARPLYPERARHFVHDNGSWLWPVVAAAAIVVGLVFLRWLLVQPRIDGVGTLVIDTEGDAASEPTAGRTRMPAHAVTDVVEDDIAALRGVRRVTAVLAGKSALPQLWLTVSTDADADVARIRAAITGEVVADARACLELPELPTFLQLRVARRASERVVR